MIQYDFLKGDFVIIVVYAVALPWLTLIRFKVRDST